jgi:hypothetical protein
MEMISKRSPQSSARKKPRSPDSKLLRENAALRARIERHKLNEQRKRIKRERAQLGNQLAAAMLDTAIKAISGG